MEAACDIFYNIYDDGGRSDIISDLVRQLDFHALSITLLATAASHNLWNYDRLAEEWSAQRSRVLQTYHNQSLAKTIELSLTSPMFRDIGPSAREILGVVAFFPQGIDERNLGWLFPTDPEVKSTMDKFCALSLTHRSHNFITMLAPIRDYIAPRDPQTSPLICATRDRYLVRLSVEVDPTKPGFDQARWIVLEDTNVEHLLNIFTSIDPNTDNVWDVCGYFMGHLSWHKPRTTVLGPKIRGLPDSHRSKPGCLWELAGLSGVLGNHAERSQLLAHALALERGRGNDPGVAKTLQCLADANRMLRLFKEGIQQAKEAVEIYERLGDTAEQADSLNSLAYLLSNDDQLDAAENAGLRAIELAPGKGQEFNICVSHRLLGQIYEQKGKKRKAIHHFETAIEIASPPKFHGELFWIHYDMASLFLEEGEFDEADAHIEQAKPHARAIDSAYYLGRAIELRASIWERQGKPENAKSEISDALKIFENVGAAQDAEICRGVLRRLDES